MQGAHNQHACLHCVLSPTLFIIHACYNYCVNFCLCLYSRIRIIVECVILYTVGSFAQPVSPVIQELMDKFQLTTTQVDRKIQQIDIPYLAIHFDNVELYVDVMELSSGEQIDVKHADTSHDQVLETLERKETCTSDIQDTVGDVGKAKEGRNCWSSLSVLEG